MKLWNQFEVCCSIQKFRFIRIIFSYFTTRFGNSLTSWCGIRTDGILQNVNIGNKILHIATSAESAMENVPYFLRIKAQLSKLTLNLYLHVCHILWYSTTYICKLINLQCGKRDCKLNSVQWDVLVSQCLLYSKIYIFHFMRFWYV